MSTFLQLLIGSLPLIIVSAVMLIRKKLKIMPLVGLLFAVVAIVTGVVLYFAGANKNQNKIQAQTTSDYLYMAEKAMLIIVCTYI